MWFQKKRAVFVGFGWLVDGWTLTPRRFWSFRNLRQLNDFVGDFEGPAVRVFGPLVVRVDK